MDQPMMPRTGDLSHLTDAVFQLAENMKAIYRHQCQSERVIMFLDNSNFFGSVARIAKEVGHKFRVDYLKLYSLLLRDRFCINAFCYYSEWETDTETRHRRFGFHGLMEKVGFSLVRFQQRPGTTREKGVDAAIVRDMLTMARDCPRCDTFLLIAGDGDYTETVKEVRQRYGVKVEVAFFASDTAVFLRETAYRFIDLEPIRDSIQLDRSFTD